MSWFWIFWWKLYFEKIFVMQRRFFGDALLKMNFKETGTRLAKVHRLMPRAESLPSASGFNTRRMWSALSWCQKYRSKYQKRLENKAFSRKRHLAMMAAKWEIYHSHAVLCGFSSAGSQVPFLLRPHGPGLPAGSPQKCPLSGGQLLYNPSGYLL